LFLLCFLLNPVLSTFNLNLQDMHTQCQQSTYHVFTCRLIFSLENSHVSCYVVLLLRKTIYFMRALSMFYIVASGLELCFCFVYVKTIYFNAFLLLHSPNIIDVLYCDVYIIRFLGFVLIVCFKNIRLRAHPVMVQLHQLPLPPR
jgi:hypothetical protein